MRDVIIFIIAFGLVPYILRHSYIGVLAWSWFSYMNPHRLTWGAAYDFPFAQMIAGTLFISLLFNREEKKFPINHLTVTWILFLVWTMITTAAAIYPDDAWTYEIQVFKIQLILFISLWMMGRPERIKLMVWVIFFSVGFFGIKGGLFTIMTGGGGRVFGPAGSFIEDNNHLAVALLMVIPLGFYLRKYEVERKLYKNLLLLCILLIAAAVLGSFSRGALLAISAVSFYLWLKTPGKLITGTLGLVILAMLILMMPSHWRDRMETITEYQKDQSAQGRLNSWQYAINLASDRVTGGGYLSWSSENFQKWAPNPSTVLVAHSIYFAVLADHGWIGLLLFFTVFTQGWFMGGRIVKNVQARGSPEDDWMAGLASMIKVSLVAYAVGGAFLSLAYFDLPWHLLVLLVLLETEAKRRGFYDKPSSGGTAAYARTNGTSQPSSVGP